MLRRNIYAHNAKIYRARKEGRSSPQRRSHLVVLTLRNLSPNRSQKRPIYHLNCESQASGAAASVFNPNLAAANPLVPTSGVSPNGSVGRITATNSQPRQIQLALKLVF